MTPVLVAEFDSAERFVAAVKAFVDEGRPPLDGLMPFHIPEVGEMLAGGRRTSIRPIMAAAGFGMAAFGFALQWFSATIAYPIDSGGRPLNSWPVFLLAPFEVGVLAAAIAGFVAVLVGCGLPRLHHPLFAYPGVERATQDRFFLLMAGAATDEADEETRKSLFARGAISIGASEA